MDNTEEVAEFASKSTQSISTESKASNTSNVSPSSNSCSRTVLDEQKKRIKSLEALLHSKEQAASTMSDRCDKLQSSMQKIDEDLKSGKLKRLSDDEMIAIKQYPRFLVQFAEQKRRMKHLEAVLQAKDHTASTLSDRYDKLQSAMDTINQDLASGTLRRLTDDEVTALQQYPVVVEHLAKKEAICNEMKKANDKLVNNFYSLKEEKQRMEDEMKEEKQELEKTIEELSDVLSDEVEKYRCLQVAYTKLKQENRTLLLMAKVHAEEKNRIKEEAAATLELTDRYNRLRSALEEINADRKSGKLKRLTSYETKALKEYPIIVMQQGTLRGRQEELQRQHNLMKREREDINRKYERLKGEPSRLSTMNNEALKQLRAELQKSIRRVEEAEEELESQRNCVMCMDNRKNVCFDGCDHMAVCQDCIGDLIPKQCPVCRAPFRTSRVLRL